MDAATRERTFIAQLLDPCSRQWPCGHKRVPSGGPAGICGSSLVALFATAVLAKHRRDLEEVGKAGGTIGCKSRGKESSCLLLHME